MSKENRKYYIQYIPLLIKYNNILKVKLLYYSNPRYILIQSSIQDKFQI